MQKEKKPKIILTGGHLSPLLAVYAGLKHKADPVLAGRKYTFENDKTFSFEYKLFSEKKVPFYDIKAGRLQRKITTKTIPSLLRSPSSLFRSVGMIKKEKPDAVLTFGGYVGLPVAVAAYLMGVPIVLHEQTHRAGLTNKIIGKIAKKICVSFSSSEKYFPPEKTVLTGNPIRHEIFFKKKIFNFPKNEKVLLVMGGSTGSHNINEIIELLLPKLLERFIVLHQTGDAQEFRDYERLERLRNKLPLNIRWKYMLKKFITPSEIGSFYDISDIIISRAGINTVSELLILKKKALLIPLSHGQKSEQLENAKYYEKFNLGTYVDEKKMSLDTLVDKLISLEEKKVPKKTIERNKDVSGEKIVSVLLSCIKNEE
jgi:UDP-N-acetylglucosamine--N-acetylmuramyl-(pentapeptide) pyrophosphoryl-undecaprenol N-acetylglucosamine transferase